MLERDGIHAEVVEGHYGELTVLVDGEPVLSAGPLGFVGVLPSLSRIRDAVQRKLADAQRGDAVDGCAVHASNRGGLGRNSSAER
jgi:hypothetical protein